LYDKALGLLGLIAVAFLLMLWVESKLASVTLRVIALTLVLAGFIFVAWRVVT
jgi:hypothetical protein